MLGAAKYDLGQQCGYVHQIGLVVKLFGEMVLYNTSSASYVFG